MVFESAFLKKTAGKKVASESVGEGVKVVHKTVPHQPYYNPTNLIAATYKVVQNNIRKAGFSVASITPERTDHKLDNSTRKIIEGSVSYMLSIMTTDGQNRQIRASVTIKDDKIDEKIAHFEDNAGRKYVFNRKGFEAFMTGLEQEEKKEESVYPMVGDAGSNSGKAGGAEPNLAFMNRNMKIMKLGHDKDSKVYKATQKIKK